MENKFSYIKERVLYISDIKHIEKEVFFKKIGITYGNFKGAAKKTPLNSTTVANILAIFEDINSEWLITGNGPILKMDAAPIVSPVVDNSVCRGCYDKDLRISELRETISVQRDLIKVLKIHSNLNVKEE